jgi:stress response protein YsnF
MESEMSERAINPHGDTDADVSWRRDQANKEEFTQKPPTRKGTPMMNDLEARAREVVRGIECTGDPDPNPWDVMNVKKALELTRAEATLAERERDGTWERLARETAKCLEEAIDSNRREILAEREACAKVADERVPLWEEAVAIAAAIRARAATEGETAANHIANNVRDLVNSALAASPHPHCEEAAEDIFDQ